MTSLPHPEKIRLRWRDHRAVWGWVLVMYRDPKFFRRLSDRIPRWRRLRTVGVFYAHLMAGVFVVSFVVLFTVGVGISSTQYSAYAARWALGKAFFLVAVGLVGGLGASGTLCFALYSALCVALGVVIGIVVGFGFAHAFGDAFGLAFGAVFGNLFFHAAGASFLLADTNDLDRTDSLAHGILLGLVSGLGFGLMFGLVLGPLFGLVLGPLFGLALAISIRVGDYRLYRLMRPSAWLSRAGASAGWRSHPVIWDRTCVTRYPRIAMKYLEWWKQEPRAVRQQLVRLIERNEFQRPAALEAFTAILARESATVLSLAALDRHLEQLPNGYEGYLDQTVELRRKAARISALQREGDTTNLPLLKRDKLTLAREAIVPFRAYVSGCAEPLCSEFLRAADAWDAALARQIAALPQEVPDFFEENLYIQAGMQAFVRREETLRELVGHLRDEAGGASLLLYARRRMGKSTLTGNLARMLPADLAAIYLSLQSPEVNTSEAHFAARVIAVLAERFPDSGLAALRDDTLPPRTDLATLATALRRLQAHLEATGRRVLIALDEFEVIDERIGEGAMSVRLLASLRDAIQTHRRIRWLFSGVNHFSELPHAEWSSYLTAFRQVEVRPFSPAETHQLLTEPMKHAQAFGDRTPALAGFFRETGFWPEPMIARIQHETQGWPALVQGVAKQVIALCNRDKVLRPTDAILEGALDAVLGSMDSTLQQLLLFSGNLPPTEKAAGEYLRGFRTADTLPPPPDDAIRRLLERHELITVTATGDWRLRVPLMLRWLRKRG